MESRKWFPQPHVGVDNYPEFSSKERDIILIVDDEKEMRIMGEIILKREGFRVLTACNGWEALQIFREQGSKISLVLLDIEMPFLDGKETFKKIRQINQHVGIILCSGYSEQETAERFEGSGFKGILEKPFDLKSFIEKVREGIKA